jgi:hypothetical protein
MRDLGSSLSLALPQISSKNGTKTHFWVSFFFSTFAKKKKKKKKSQLRLNGICGS